MSVTVKFLLNNRDIKAEVPPDLTLLQLLRHHLHLTGTKRACEQGHCGACTVIINGKAERSCLMKMSKVDGKRIETIEGLGTPDGLHPLQEAFVASGAVQCGFCTPGMIMGAKALLEINPNPTMTNIESALSGNLCRCGTYARVIRAVQKAGGGPSW